MFTAKQLKERMNETPFKPFRIRMSNGEAYDVKTHDDAFVLSNAIEVGIEQDRDGFALLTRRLAILHIASIEDLPASTLTSASASP
jgi:hypothetical protein